MLLFNIVKGLLVSATVSYALLQVPSVLATTGCNAVGWDWMHDDVHGCDVYYPAIQWMYDEGIAEGELLEVLPAGEKRLFHPDRPINRAEFTKIVLLASGDRAPPPPCTENPFPDVMKDAWYAPYICAAKKKGIISGFPDGTFKPSVNINVANGSKILTKSFGVTTDSSDLKAIDGQELWYKPYVFAMLRKNAIAPTVRAFDHLITRGEMAEMVYRLANDKPSYVMPSPETDGEPLGMGYTNPFSLEFTLGLWADPPDPPYFFTEDVTTLWGNTTSLSGYRFIHVLPSELRCSESGMWEHCKPVFIDSSIGLYVTDQPIENMKNKFMLFGALETLYFGGKKGECVTAGVEGENTQFCFVPLGSNKTLIVVREFLDTNVIVLPGVISLHTSDAWFTRLRKTMEFSE